MDNQIRDIVNKFKYSREIRVYSNKHYKGDNSYYATVRNNKDVEIAYNSIENHIETISEMGKLHREDIIDLEKTMAMYEIAVNKVISLYQHSINNSYSYSAEELQNLIDNIYNFYDDIIEQRTRQAMQD